MTPIACAYTPDFLFRLMYINVHNKGRFPRDRRSIVGSSSHINLFAPQTGCIYHAHSDNTECLLLAHCVHKYVFGSLQHIKCFTTPRTPTLSHTLFSHAPCVTPHPMTGCLAVIQFSQSLGRPTPLHSILFVARSTRVLRSTTSLYFFTFCVYGPI